MKPQIEPGWYAQLQDEFAQPYMADLRTFLLAEREHGKRIYPPASQWFAAFDRTPFEQVRVVILGQDPYHGPRQAHGLCFSVQDGVPLPPSLRNIFAELKTDLGLPSPASGNLEKWAAQGVLLLNATLTVQAHQAGSHQNRGWEQFTDAAVRQLNEQRSGLVFMLWGSYAQRKGAQIDPAKHLILKAPHPSPLSAQRGFFGCRHFSQANTYLRQQNIPEIDWRL
ncbi:MAG: uracil-DNA glycosylase [Cellvibrionales bacterium]|nr:uracil-DNA glycosylase [Cellvibrionales bacterium]